MSVEDRWDFIALFVIITVYTCWSFIGVTLKLSELGFISVFKNRLGMWFEFDPRTL